MKLLLIAIHPHRSPQAVPLACAFLREAVLAQPDLAGTVRVEIAEFLPCDTTEECCREIVEREPDVVAFSVYVWNRESVLETATRLRRERPDLKIVAGGPEPTANPLSILASGCFDAVVRGEGEAVLPEVMRRVMRGAPLTGLSGATTPGALGSTLAAPMELERIPSPYLSGRLDPREVGGALWQLSRGCDFACAFCYDHKGSGGVRRFSIQRLEEELRLFARVGVPQVFVLDSTFNKIPERAKEILRLIAEVAPGIHFHFEVRSEYIDPEMADLFASITCSLQIGLQSASRDVLRRVGRSFDADDFAHRVMHLNESGAIFGFDLIYGLPGDTLAMFRESLDFALSLYPNHLDIFPLAVLPGTRLYGKAQDLGLLHRDTPPYTLISTSGFSADELEDAAALAAACDIFYSRGKAVAWFNSVLSALRLSPSSFLSGFAEWLGPRCRKGEDSISDEEIWGLQRQFLEKIFTARKKSKFLPLALDLVDYHHHYAAALLAPSPRIPSPRDIRKMDLMKVPLGVAPSATVARFNYEILEILDAGEVDLPLFASSFRPTGSFAVIYPNRGEICTESIDSSYFNLLQKLDGRSTAASACRELRISRQDGISFLEFALSEGILSLASPLTTLS